MGRQPGGSSRNRDVGVAEAGRVHPQEGGSASGAAFRRWNYPGLSSTSHLNLPYPPLFQICLARSQNLATVPFPQLLAVKAHPSEIAGAPSLCPSNPAPTLSFAYQSASEKMLTNCRPPEVPRFFCLASIFRLISFAIFVSIVLNFARFLPRGNFYSSILKPLQLRIYPGNDTIQLEQHKWHSTEIKGYQDCNLFVQATWSTKMPLISSAP